MTRPLTCLTLIAAAGAGLYLYQEKHRAQLLDREINRVVHATEQTRERIGLMRAEWALLNEPDRLAGLAAQHLGLQSVTPAQFAQAADLGQRLPAVGATVPPPVPPIALDVSASVIAPPDLTPHPPAPLTVQATPPVRTPRPTRVAAIRPPEPSSRPAYAPAYTPGYAPVMQAFASQSPMPVIRPPTVQQAAAGLPSPYVGSALGMARTTLADPVPIAVPR